MKLRGRTSVVLNASLVGVLLVAGGGTWWALRGDAQPTANQPRTTAVARGTVTATVSASGNVAIATQTTVNFATSGTVTEINAQVGKKVAKGAVLARLDPTDAEAALATAKAQLSSAQAQLGSAQAQLTEAIANRDAAAATPTPTNGQPSQQTQSPEALDAAVAQAQSQVTNAQAQVTSAQQQVDKAQRDVDRCTLTAPTAGTVLSLSGSVGSTVSAGGTTTGSGAQGTGSSGGTGSSTGASGFLVIADLTRLNAKAAFTEADVAKVKVGQAATVTPNAQQDRQFTGTVTAIDPTSTVTSNVVTYGVTIALSGDVSSLRPGQTVSAQVTVGRATAALSVPSIAVTNRGGQQVVTVFRDGQEQTVAVEVGLQGDLTTQILSGLAEGDQVVLTTPGAATTTGGTGNGGNRFGGGGFPPGVGGPAGGGGGGR